MRTKMPVFCIAALTNHVADGRCIFEVAKHSQSTGSSAARMSEFRNAALMLRNTCLAGRSKQGGIAVNLGELIQLRRSLICIPKKLSSFAFRKGFDLTRF